MAPSLDPKKCTNKNLVMPIQISRQIVLTFVLLDLHPLSCAPVFYSALQYNAECYLIQVLAHSASLGVSNVPWSRFYLGLQVQTHSVSALKTLMS